MALNSRFGSIWSTCRLKAYVERAHALPSPVMQGPGNGSDQVFFLPRLHPRHWRAAARAGLVDAPAALGTTPDAKRRWLAGHGIAWENECLVSLFCYEPEPLAALLRQWATQPRSTRLLVSAGRATKAVQAALATLGPLATDFPLQINYLPPLSQTEFDQLLCCCDLNFVRGEDSLVRAIWAGKPLVWHIYPQDDDAHHAKLMAFLDVLQAPPSLVQFHRLWNGVETLASEGNLAEWLPADLDAWRSAVQSLQARLLQMDDLTTQLIEFVQKKR